MISQDFIRALAGKLQTTELNIRREYAQHLFLSYFYRQPQTSSLCFKGGTALRLIFGSPRFSEDLDFSTPLTPIKSLENLIIDTLAAIEKENLETEIVESKKTTWGYLSHLQINSTALELNISMRNADIESQIITIAGDFLPPYTIVSLAQNQLVTQKLTALLTRQKPRDFYDLYFILRKNLLQPGQKNILSDVLRALTKATINFEFELKQFLPKSHWPIIRDFKSSLIQEIRRNL